MSEMIERVARALMAVSKREVLGDIEPQWLLFRDDARAAIEAMREPTHEMVHAAGLSDVSCHEGCGIYQDMIDAALT